MNKVISISFSPCGSTKKTANLIAEELAKKNNLPFEEALFTLPKDREEVKNFSKDDLVVISSPTYAGKLPNKIMPDFKEKLKGNDTPCVAIVTFGNRSFDNSLAELVNILKANGFKIVAAAAIVNEHSFAHIGCLNKEDVLEFASKINLESEIKEVAGDADAPYYVPKKADGEPAKFLPAKPLTDMSKCTKCMACARNCPMGSIDMNDPSLVPGICIKCHSCVNRCTKNAKYFDNEDLASHIKMLKENYSEIKESVFYY